MAYQPVQQPYDIILAGAFGVGKSTVFRELSTEVHSEHLYSSCPGGDTSTTSLCSRHLDKWTHSAQVLGDTIKVTLWDTGSLERAGIRNMTRSYFRTAVGVVLIYSVSSRESLDALHDWMVHIKDSATQPSHQRPIRFVVWGNSKDQGSDVSADMLQAFITYHGLSQDDCYTVNSYTGSNVFESYHALLEKVHETLRLSGRGLNSSNEHRTVSQTLQSSTSSSNSISCSC